MNRSNSRQVLQRKPQECRLCRAHGIKNFQKDGHKNNCRFEKCDIRNCPKCKTVKLERRSNASIQRLERKKTRNNGYVIAEKDLTEDISESSNLLNDLQPRILELSNAIIDFCKRDHESTLKELDRLIKKYSLIDQYLNYDDDTLDSQTENIGEVNNCDSEIQANQNSFRLPGYNEISRNLKVKNGELNNLGHMIKNEVYVLNGSEWENKSKFNALFQNSVNNDLAVNSYEIQLNNTQHFMNNLSISNISIPVQRHENLQENFEMSPDFVQNHVDQLAYQRVTNSFENISEAEIKQLEDFDSDNHYPDDWMKFLTFKSEK